MIQPICSSQDSVFAPPQPGCWLCTNHLLHPQPYLLKKLIVTMVIRRNNLTILLATIVVIGLAGVESFAPTTSSRCISSRRVSNKVFQQQLLPKQSTSFSTTSTSLNLVGLDDETTQKLIVLSYEKLIEAGIPAVFFIITTAWFLSQFRDKEDGPSRGGARRGGMMGSGRGRGRKGGRGMMGRGGDPYAEGRPLGPVEELYDDIYDDLSGPEEPIPPLLKLLGGGGGPGKRGGGGPNGNKNNINRPTSKLNIGIPKRQYLKVTKLNSKYDSYRYSMISATQGKALAASELRAKGFNDAFYRALGLDSNNSNNHNLGLTSAEGTALIKLERDFLSVGSELVKNVAELTREITNAAVLDEMESMGVEAGVLDAIIDAEVIWEDATSVTDAQKDFFGIGTSSEEEEQTDDKNNNNKNNNNNNKKKKDNKNKSKQAVDIQRAVKEVEAMNTEIMLLELDFIQGVVEVLGPNRADAMRTTLVGNMINGEVGILLKTLKERPLTTILSSFSGEKTNGSSVVSGGHSKKNLYVTRFPGDVSASRR